MKPKKTLRKILLAVMSVILWSMLEVKGKPKINGDKFEYSFILLNRYYSPVYWLAAILFLPFYLLKEGLLAWTKDLFPSQSDTSDISERVFEGTFKPNTPKWAKKLDFWLMAYGHYS